MRQTTIKFSNRMLYTLITVGVLILLGVGVYAIAPNPGHDYSNLDLGPITIDGDKVGIGTAWPSMDLSIGHASIGIDVPSDLSELAIYHGGGKKVSVNLLNVAILTPLEVRQGSTFSGSTIFYDNVQLRASNDPRDTGGSLNSDRILSISGNNPSLILSDTSQPTSDYYEFNLNAHTLTLASKTVPRITISPEGNVGIGTTIPGAKLDVAGSIKAGSVISLGGVCWMRDSDYFSWSECPSGASFAGGMTLSGTISIATRENNNWHSPTYVWWCCK